MSRSQNVILTNMCLIEDDRRFGTQNVMLGQELLYQVDTLSRMKAWLNRLFVKLRKKRA